MAASEVRGKDDSSQSLQQLVSDIAILVRHEIELAKNELAKKVKSAGVGAGMLSASALAAIFTLGSLTALIVAALSLALPLWAALAIVTLIWALGTGTLAMLGKRKVEDASPFVPEQTIENIKEDVACARRGGK